MRILKQSTSKLKSYFPPLKTHTNNYNKTDDKLYHHFSDYINKNILSQMELFLSDDDTSLMQ